MDEDYDLNDSFEKLRDELMTHRESAYSSETELHGLRRKLMKQEQKMKHEQYMRRRYPAVNEAYKQYQMMLKLTQSNK
tara:strand:+ start:1532 stop:1765 length:234 start_codon:yes stop_codon:yes gene_type:complete